MADPRLVARNYNHSNPVSQYHLPPAAQAKVSTTKGLEVPPEIMFSSPSSKLLALSFTCDANTALDNSTPVVVLDFITAIRETSLSDDQMEVLRQSLIETLPDYLNAEIRTFLPESQAGGTPAATLQRLAAWLTVNTKAAQLIESLQSLPDPDQRMLDAIDYLWLNKPHHAIAEFQGSLQLARKNEELGAATTGLVSSYMTDESVRDEISDALRHQLAALSGLKPQFDALAFTSMEAHTREAEANKLINLNCIASSVMQPLARLGGGEKIRVMLALVEGNTDAGHPSVKEAYEREKKDYLARHAENEADATAAFEKAFLCKAIPLLGGDSASDAISIVNGPGSHEKIKSDLNVLLTHYRAFMYRVCDM